MCKQYRCARLQFLLCFLVVALLCGDSIILASLAAAESDYSYEEDGSASDKKEDYTNSNSNGECPNNGNNDQYLPPTDNPQMMLRNGVGMPLFSLGLSHFTIGAPHADNTENQIFAGFYPEKAYRQIELALQNGLRSFDTALMYGTQPHLGQVLGQWWASGRLQTRKEVFITTKVFHQPAVKFGLKRNHQWNLDQMTPAQVTVQTEDHIEQCLKELQMGYIDLLLMHWPSGVGHDEMESRQRRLAAWKVFEDFYHRGWARAIGVSNFSERHIDQLMQDGATIWPMVNQIEASPYLQYDSILSYSQQHDIQVQAFSPLGNGVMNVQADPTLLQLAETHDKDVGQVVFRYLIQRGYAIAFQTNSPDRMVSNLSVFDFELSDEEMHMIYSLSRVSGSFGLTSPYDLP